MISNQGNEELVRKDPAGEKPGAAAAAVARQWSASTESRIVRVSRVFGGKDRHSKVRTVKGLRDRRVRLSVQTAIQLYDLQDRLGLNQPSKVVDWLLNAAQHEIDKLPPLQFPPQDLVAHLPSSMPLSNGDVVAAAAATPAPLDSQKGGSNAVRGFMSLNNSLGLVNGGMPLGAHGSYYTADAWSNGNVHEASTAASAHMAVAHHTPFPSLLSLAPGSQLVFYSPDGASGFSMKEPDQFAVHNLDSQGGLSLSSARSFLHSGSNG